MSTPRSSIWLLPIIAAICVSCSQDQITTSVPVDPRWAASTYWDQGQAEVATYDATRVIYGVPRPHTLTMITVKETFTPEFNTKADEPTKEGTFEVFKVNLVTRVETDSYPYQLMSSLFLQRHHPDVLHKMVTSTQEWCGTTYKSVTRSAALPTLTYHSYWDGEGDGTLQLERDAIYEDQLVTTLRALPFTKQTTFTARVYPSLLSTKVGVVEPLTASFRVVQDSVRMDSTSVRAWRVDMNTSTTSAQWWFDTQIPHHLLRFEHSDGRRMTLRSIRRSAYWERK